MMFDEFVKEVSRRLREKYGITWGDACGETEPLKLAWEAKESPWEFVRQWGEKYDLAPIEQSGRKLA